MRLLTKKKKNDALNGRVGWEFLGMMNNYVFADGTPFGVKIEKEE